jgi:micrococcal nuclease
MIALLISVVFAGCAPAEEQSGNRQDVENTGVEETQQEQAWTGDEKSSYNQDLKGLKAEVLSVIDGDTLKVRLENGREERVRLTLIDTPETKHPKVGVQPFGKEASKFTKAQLNGKISSLKWMYKKGTDTGESLLMYGQETSYLMKS